MRRFAILAVAALAVLGSGGAALARSTVGIGREGMRSGHGVGIEHRGGGCCWGSPGIWFAPPVIYGTPYYGSPYYGAPDYGAPVYTPSPAYPPYETTVAVQEWNGSGWVTVSRRVTAYYDANTGRYYYILDGQSHWL